MLKHTTVGGLRQIESVLPGEGTEMARNRNVKGTKWLGTETSRGRNGIATEVSHQNAMYSYYKPKTYFSITLTSYWRWQP